MQSLVRVQAFDWKEDAFRFACDTFERLDVKPTTIADYQARIGLFLEFMKNRVLNHDTFLEFKRYLRERNDYAISTKSKYLVSAKVFLKELNRCGFLPVDITQNIKTFPQIKKHKREGLNEDEVRRLSEKVRELSDNPRGVRLKVLFCLLALQGLRQIEIIRLNVEDLNLGSKIAFVQGKGQDDKELVHLAPETVKAIKRYLSICKIGSGALFRSLGNRKSERITTMTIKREIKRLFEVLGIENVVHGFRHYYITTLLKNMEVRDVRKFSRHKSLEMLIVYDDEMDIRDKSEEVFRCFEGLKISSNVS